MFFCVRDRSGILMCSDSGTKDLADSPTRSLRRGTPKWFFCWL